MKRLPALLFFTFLAYGSAHAASPEPKEAIRFSLTATVIVALAQQGVEKKTGQ